MSNNLAVYTVYKKNCMFGLSEKLASYTSSNGEYLTMIITKELRYKSTNQELSCFYFETDKLIYEFDVLAW